MSRRQQIAMSPPEIADYLASQLTVIVVSNGRDGYPHPMPMHFCVEALPFRTPTQARWPEAPSVRSGSGLHFPSRRSLAQTSPVASKAFVGSEVSGPQSGLM